MGPFPNRTLRSGRPCDEVPIESTMNPLRRYGASAVQYASGWIRLAFTAATRYRRARVVSIAWAVATEGRRRARSRKRVMRRP